jgi:hypothetical protein
MPLPRFPNRNLKTRDLHPMAGPEAATGHARPHNWRAS